MSENAGRQGLFMSLLEAREACDRIKKRCAECQKRLEEVSGLGGDKAEALKIVSELERIEDQRQQLLRKCDELDAEYKKGPQFRATPKKPAPPGREAP